jgi:hypothetical protein
VGTGDETRWRPPTLGLRSATGGIPTQSVGTMGSPELVAIADIFLADHLLGLGQLVDRPIAAKALGNHIVVGVGNGHH